MDHPKQRRKLQKEAHLALGDQGLDVTGKGSYVLVLRLDELRSANVGRLGRVSFPPGVYLYFGSALNGLDGRIQRHLSRNKKIHWHIDRLTSLASIEEVWWMNDGINWECDWADEAAELPGWVSSIAGFGSSDCQCSSHLHVFESVTSLESIRRRLQRVCGRRFKRAGTTAR